MGVCRSGRGRRAAFAAGRFALALPLTCAALCGCHRSAASPPPSGEVLKVEMGKATKPDPDAALRCFVHGQFVGMQTPPACAEKNGIPPGALDVGLDQSGALAAGARDTPLQPLANATGDDASDDNTTGDDQMADARQDDSGDDGPGQPGRRADADDDGGGDDGQAGGIGEVAGCLRFGRFGWRDAGRAVTLNACVHALFDGRCLEPGEALFGRWGSETLRLVPGRVGISPDNRNFHLLLPQDPDDCSIPGG